MAFKRLILIKLIIYLLRLIWKECAPSANRKYTKTSIKSGHYSYSKISETTKIPPKWLTKRCRIQKWVWKLKILRDAFNIEIELRSMLISKKKKKKGRVQNCIYKSALEIHRLTGASNVNRGWCDHSQGKIKFYLEKPSQITRIRSISHSENFWDPQLQLPLEI